MDLNGHEYECVASLGCVQAAGGSEPSPESRSQGARESREALDLRCLLLAGGGEGGGRRPLRLMIADGHPVVRKGVRACLAGYKQFQVVGEAGDGAEALRKAWELRPDVVLMGIELPRLSGLAATESLRRELPGVKVLILSGIADPDYAMRIVKSGARGSVLKEAPVEQLVQAIEAISRGETFFGPELTRAALSGFIKRTWGDDELSRLSEREQEVLAFVAEGLTNKEIALQLNLSVRTIETHRQRLMRKLDIHSAAGLTRFALAKGLVVFPEEVPGTCKGSARRPRR